MALADTMVDAVLASIEGIVTELRYEVDGEDTLKTDKLQLLGFIVAQNKLRKARQAWDNFAKKHINLPPKVYTHVKAGSKLSNPVIELKKPKK